jgi:hypothetical protein
MKPGGSARHLCVKIEAYHVLQLGRLVRVIRLPFPGYFPVMAIFPGFQRPEYPVTRSPMSGVGYVKRLIKKALCAVSQADFASGCGFLREFSRQAGNFRLSRPAK